MDWLSEIVSGKELDSAKRERTKDYIFTTQVEEAQARYESDGWEFDRALARRRVKLKKKKPLTRFSRIVCGRCCTNLVFHT